jgi:hypothetical protein
MRLQEYRQYLLDHDVKEEEIAKRMILLEDFTQFLPHESGKEFAANVGKKEAEQYAHKLIAENRNTLENFSTLIKYTRWLEHQSLYVALLELTDCYNAMEVLSEKIRELHGQELCSRIFLEEIPPLGADEKERYSYTARILKRMEELTTPEESKATWFKVQHGIRAEEWQEDDLAEKEKFKNFNSIDEYLSNRKKERDEMLTRLHDEGKLWYTIEITDEVLEFIKADPEIEAGRREGDKIYLSKVPYNAVRYLHETDPQIKRYYACHCPLVREAILQGKTLSADICSCSLGHASHYLAGLDQQVSGEVLESAVKGDPRCRFVFTLI